MKEENKEKEQKITISPEEDKILKEALKNLEREKYRAEIEKESLDREIENAKFDEVRVLSSVFSDEKNIQTVLMLKLQDNIKVFSNKFYQQVFDVFCHFFEESRKIEIDGVEEYFRTQKINLAQEENALIREKLRVIKYHNTPGQTSESVRSLCLMIIHRWKENQRSLFFDRVSSGDLNRLTSLEYISEFDNFIEKIKIAEHEDNTVYTDTIKDNCIEKLKEAQQMIPLGFPSLDRILGGGITFGELTGIAGRMSHGKTTISLCIVKNILKNEDMKKYDDPSYEKMGVGFFSIEVSLKKMLQKMLANDFDMPTRELVPSLTGFNDRMGMSCEITRSLDETRNIFEENFAICHDGGLDFTSFSLSVRKMMEKANIRIFFIDHLFLMSCKDFDTNSKMTREQQLSTLSRKLKRFAEEMNIIIVILLQQNREITSRSAKKPKLSDIAHCDAIAQNSDKIFFTHIPYKYEDQKQDELGNLTEDTLEIFVEKNRDGECGKTTLYYKLAHHKIEELPEEIEKLKYAIPISKRQNKKNEESLLPPF